MSSTQGAQASKHPIQVVARRTGLTPDVLRAWERRFGVVEPVRAGNGRRLYSDADIERLRLLGAATREGWSISRVAAQSNDELRDLLTNRAEPRVGTVADPSVDLLLRGALDAVADYDAAALDAQLWRAVVALSPADFFDRVLSPLLVEIGRQWRAGAVRPAMEHIATGVIRRVLGRIADAVDMPDAQHRLVVGTLVGQVHDIGALLVAASAAAEGWAVTYVGADLPAADIAMAARRTGARFVALSLIHPADDPRIPGELATLREKLPRGVELLVGGAAATAYGPAVRAADGLVLPDLETLRDHLRHVARGGRAGKSA